jgi:cbb3-type cytochrome oxidase maturation protein
MMHIILLLSALALSGLFLWLFVWAVKSGQFKDPEEAKYLLFREPDDTPPAEQENQGGKGGRRTEKASS